jgi:hypothetical protein
MISALTWWVGNTKEFDVDRATISAYMAGSAPTFTAMLTVRGTSSTVAPTFDMTSVKRVARTATTAWRHLVSLDYRHYRE